MQQRRVPHGGQRVRLLHVAGVELLPQRRHGAQQVRDLPVRKYINLYEKMRYALLRVLLSNADAATAHRRAYGTAPVPKKLCCWTTTKQVFDG